MAQVLKLKRTSVAGKIPTTSNLELGELAMNTYDGRIFFEKDSGTPVVSEILTTNTENYITGSLTLKGNVNVDGTVTASYFVGDGSQLTNIQATISENATVTSSFDNQSSIAVTHNFDSKNIIVSVYDTNDAQIIPQSVVLTNSNTVTIGLSSAQSGYIVVAKGGHIVSGSVSSLDGQNGSYYLDFDNHTNNPFTQSVGEITASGHFVPSQHETYDLGSSTLRWRDLYLSGSTIDLGGTKISRDASGNVELSDGGGTLKTLKVAELEIGTGDKKVKLKIDDNDKVRFEDSDSGTTEAPTYYKESISGASSYNITHSLEEDYPIVQVYDSSKEQVVPLKVKSTSSTVVQIQFANTFSGTVVVKK